LAICLVISCAGFVARHADLEYLRGMKKPTPPSKPLPSKLPDIRSEAPVAFLREVDDALHAERMEMLWKEWKHAIVVFVVVLVSCTAGWQLFKVWRAQQQDKYATEWYVATSGEAPVIPAGMDDAPQPGLRALAAFATGQEAMKANPPKVDEAVAAYTQVVEDSGAPQWLRDWASLNVALVQAGSSPDGAKQVLDKLVADKESPMHAPALEVRAALAQKEGDAVTARQLTNQLLALPDLPAQLSMRARQRLGELSTLAN
jgi:hypothetical protein